MFWTIFSDEARQRVDHGQSLIARRDAATTRLLQVLKEQSHLLGCDIADGKLIDVFVKFGGDEWKHQGQRVTVTSLRIAREVAFTHQMFKEKAAHPGT